MHSRLRTGHLARFALLAALASGCGGSAKSGPPVDAGPADAVTDGAGPPDAASDALLDGTPSTDGSPGSPDAGGLLPESDASATSACPFPPTQNGAPCTAAQADSGVECEYPLSADAGVSPNPGCNEVLFCLDVGTGIVVVDNSAARGGADCSGSCPASYPGASSAEGCGHGTGCAYPEGQCVCEYAYSDGPTIWFCTPTTASCPVPRPALGSACSSEGLSCDYGGCTESGEGNELCAGGAWICR